MFTPPDARASSGIDFSACCSALTKGLGATGARALAMAFVRSAPLPTVKLAGASYGASAAFTELCLALAEAPADTVLRQIEVVGLGRVAWKSCLFNDSTRSALLLFALHDVDHVALGACGLWIELDAHLQVHGRPN